MAPLIVTIWLPDRNVKYLQGKHVALVLVAVLIILIGVPYTIILFLWQWLVCVPNWKIFRWTRNAKLNTFVSVHHVPYNSKYCYWTGLLLLVRVVLYISHCVCKLSNFVLSDDHLSWKSRFFEGNAWNKATQ